MTDNTYNDWVLVALSPFKTSTLVLVCSLVLLSTALLVWSYRKAKHRRLLMLFRVLTAILVLGFITEPALQMRAVQKIQNRLAIVVDRSKSMQLSNEKGQTRYDFTREVLKNSSQALQKLAQDHLIEWYDLDGPITQATLNLPPQGEQTDLIQALERIKQQGSSKPLAGILLISDGIDNVSVDLKNSELSSEAQVRLKNLNVPVNTLDAASSLGFKDLAILDITTDEFAFVHNTLRFDIALQATGFKNLTVPVTLKREGSLVSTKEVQLDDEKVQHVIFETKPDAIGEAVYTVSMPVFAGEALNSNNERSVVVQVIRDKIRVLQVCGRPSFDERFLRQLLKENPNVDLISFFILRTPTDDPGAERDLSLIPFPVDELFTTELASFDVVIFQNFDFRPYKMAHYLPNIRNAVKKGLGFVMIGGDQSFNLGGYDQTAIAEILPVRLENSSALVTASNAELTTSGEHHPITDLAVNRNAFIWKNLPALPSVNALYQLNQEASALVESKTKNNEKIILIAAKEVEEGRTLTIASDYLWHWRFADEQPGFNAERMYYRFWSNALRWLVRDPEHAHVRVTPERRRFQSNHSVEVGIAVLDKEYQTVEDAELNITLERIGVAVLHVEDIISDKTGHAQMQYPHLDEGAYRVTVKARLGKTLLGQGVGTFMVTEQSAELDQANPKPEILQAIAKTTKAKHAVLSNEALADLTLLRPEAVEINKRRNIELWDNTWALIIAVILFAAEWAYRRRRGYL